MEKRSESSSSLNIPRLLLRLGVALVFVFFGNVITAYAAAPSITSLSLSAGPAGPESGVEGMGFDIVGANFGATKGNSTVLIGTMALTVVSWSDTKIVVQVPFGAVTGAVKVTVGGTASNTKTFTVTSLDGVCPTA